MVNVDALVRALVRELGYEEYKELYKWDDCPDPDCWECKYFNKVKARLASVVKKHLREGGVNV